jgi:hypothetical protein
MGFVFIGLYFGKVFFTIDISLLLNFVSPFPSGGLTVSSIKSIIKILIQRFLIYILNFVIPKNVNPVNSPTSTNLLPSYFGEWNLLAIGVLLASMSFGNFIATISTFISSGGGKKVTDIKEWTYSFLYGTQNIGVMTPEFEESDIMGMQGVVSDAEGGEEEKTPSQKNSTSPKLSVSTSSSSVLSSSSSISSSTPRNRSQQLNDGNNSNFKEKDSRKKKN